MKFLLVLVALFCLAYCDIPQFGETADDRNIGETADDKISQDFDKLVDNAEDPLEKKEDKDVSSEGHISYIPCIRCICTKPNAYGFAAYALCWRCYYKKKFFYWRVCTNCFCCGRKYGYWDVYFAFCRTCFK